jgi:hypothetical protein
MEPFRRPLGVLIAALAIGLLGIAIARANPDARGGGIAAAQLIGSLGIYVALGALGVIVWRLIRNRPSA